MEIIKDYEKSFRRLGREYRQSGNLILNRICELKAQIEAFDIAKQGADRKSKRKLQTEIELLEDRIKALQAIHRTTKEIGIEANNYYKRGWWRSEKYTTNSRKSRLPVFYYGFIIKDEDEYQREADREDETGSEDCDGDRIDGESEDSDIDVLSGREEDTTDSQGIREGKVCC